jgi:glycerophosphoryl diester phosphodiesterase
LKKRTKKLFQFGLRGRAGANTDWQKSFASFFRNDDLPFGCLTVFEIQGHRGARGLWPENTLAGFTGAAALGVRSVELDVRLSRDGVPVVCHDDRLNPDIARLGGAWIAAPGPAIGDLCFAELAAFDVGRVRPESELAARFPAQAPADGARIPALRAVLALLRGRGVLVDIELKVAGGGGAALVEAVLGTVAAEADAGMVRVRSFDFAVLRLVRAARPEWPLAWLTGADAEFGGVLAEAAQGGWPRWRPVWAPDHGGLRRDNVAAARAAGLAVIPWTVNAPDRMRALRDWGVYGICTDRPDILLTI